VAKKPQPIGLDEQQAQDLYDKVELIFLRDHSFLKQLMEDVAGAQPEMLYTTKKRMNKNGR
jgi:hypothetical protein